MSQCPSCGGDCGRTKQSGCLYGTGDMTYPLPKADQDKAAALAKKMLAVAKGASPAVTAMAGKLVIDLVVFVHESQKPMKAKVKS